MKKIILLSFLFIIITACKVDINFGGVSGNKHVVTEKRKANQPFTEVRASNGLNVYITQGKRPSIEVETDENLQEIIKTSISNGVLKIYSDKNIRRAKAKNIYVTLPEITKITATSGSEIRTENTVSSKNIVINTSSGASINAQINADEISSSSTSGSDLKLSGKAINYTANASSGSSTKSYSLKSKNVTVKATSGANIDVFASESIMAKANSGGDIDYKGNPEKLKVKSSSGGSVSAH